MVTCSWGLCKNNSQKNPTLRFIPFVKPFGRFADEKRAKRWVHLCGRKNFTVDMIKRTSYICAHHFPNYHEKKDFNPILNKGLEPYSCLSSYLPPKFVKTKGNTIEKKPEIPADLHNVSSGTYLNSNTKTYSKPKVTTVSVPYGVELAKAENIDAQNLVDVSPIKLGGLEHKDFVESIEKTASAEEIIQSVESAGV